MSNQEGEIAISEEFWKKMGSNPLFRENPQDTDLNNARRASLHATFLPMALFLEQQGELPFEATPEALIEATIRSKTLQVKEEERAACMQFSPVMPVEQPQQRDWVEEAGVMAMQGEAHPVRRLRGLVVAKLLPPARLKLSMS